MKRTRIGVSLCSLFVLAAALGAGRAFALTDEEIFRDFRFNFINPGAQALGLGGAAIASANDATAAQSNPAALHFVTRHEIFGEYRYVRPDQQFSSQRTGNKSVSNLALPFLNSTAVNDPENQSLLSFASYAFPFNLGPERCTLALSRQVVLDVETDLTDERGGATTSLDFSTDEFPIVVNPSGQTLESYTVRNTVEGTLDAQLVHYNVGFSLSLGDDFSLGATGTYATLDMRSDVTSTTLDPRGILFSANPRAQEGGESSPIVSKTSIDDSDSAVAYTVGLHWHPDAVFPSGESPVRFGLVYRKGEELAVRETTCETDPATGGAECTPTEEFDNVLRVPDRFGIGVSYRTNPWLFTADLERIQYSDLLTGFKERVNFFTSGRIPADLLDIRTLRFDVDDATVVHAGVQYTFRLWDRWSESVWAGYFNAPDNRIRLAEVSVAPTSPGDPQSVASARRVENLYKRVFGKGKSENHYTLGFQLAAPKTVLGYVTVQIAADIGGDGDQVLGSVVWRFGGVKR